MSNDASKRPSNRFSVGDEVQLASAYKPEGQSFQVPEGTIGVIKKKLFSELRGRWVYDIKAGKTTYSAVPQHILRLIKAGNGSSGSSGSSSDSSEDTTGNGA